MKLRKIHKGIVLAISAGWLVLGCELVVDFDRTKIPVDSTDATPDVDIDTSTVPEASADAADAAETSVDAADASDAGDADAG